MQGLCTAVATKSLGAHVCYSPDVCGHSTHRHILSMNKRYLAVDATPGGCTKYWNEIKYDVIWFCSFCFRSVPVNPLIKDRSSYQILFYMLGINCIKLVFGYLYFFRILFLKYKQKLGGKLENRLSRRPLSSPWTIVTQTVFLIIGGIV